MTLRRRFALVTATLVALAVVTVAVLGWFATRREVLGQIDRSLSERAAPFQRFDRPPGGFGDRGFPVGPPRELRAFGRGDILLQALATTGIRLQASTALPVDATDRAVATGTRRDSLRTVSIKGEDYRMLTVHMGTGGAIQLARSLAESNDTLTRLGVLLAIVSLLGVGAAAVVGFLTARRALRPVAVLTETAESIAREQRLEQTIPVERNDEIGRLATSLNTMLAALSDSRTRQQQLIDDASHELRTPLTSLRANIELLQHRDSIPTEQRKEIVDDAVFELGELTHLVTELVDLATSEHSPNAPLLDVRLDQLVEGVAARFRRRTDRTIAVTATPTLVVARPARLERAVANLVDNAAKWSPPDTPIEITVAGGAVRVRDHGPGIPDGERELVFERFHRATNNQHVPGSGLGLAIVRDVAVTHGGRVFAEAAEGGGAVVGFAIPPVAIDDTASD